MSPRTVLVAVSLALFAPIAHAKLPAYFVSDVGFSTKLHGVPESDRREECLDIRCSERGGVVVAEGESQGVRTVIREHKRSRELKRGELGELAEKMLSHDAEASELRSQSGRAAGGHNALEQWAQQGACGRMVKGRVLVSLANKVVEIETNATLGSDPRETARTLGRMHEVLRGIRVRRLGDEPLDPISEPPPVKAVLATLEKCLSAPSRPVE